MPELIPIVSYPKSGNTWLRFLVANLYKKEDDQKIDFKNINKYSCTSFKEISKIDFTLLKTNSPLFIKQHASLNEITSTNYLKVLYIYRNGFDVIKSYKHFTDAQQPGLYKNFKIFVKNYWGYCGHWGDHIESWMVTAPQELKVLPIKYERLQEDTAGVVDEVVKFIGISLSEERINDAIKSSSKENMKSLGGSKDFMKAKKDDFHFVRKAKVGDHNKLDNKIKEIFLSHNANYEIMKKLKYIDPDTERPKKNEQFSGILYHKFLKLKYRVFNR